MVIDKQLTRSFRLWGASNLRNSTGCKYLAGRVNQYDTPHCSRFSANTSSKGFVSYISIGSCAEPECHTQELHNLS